MKYERAKRQREKSVFLLVNDILEWKSKDSRAFLNKNREK